MTTPRADPVRERRFAGRRTSRRTRSRTILLTATLTITLGNEPLDRCAAFERLAWLEILQSQPGCGVNHRHLPLARRLDGSDCRAPLDDAQTLAIAYILEPLPKVLFQLLHRDDLAHSFTFPRSASAVNARTSAVVRAPR